MGNSNSRKADKREGFDIEFRVSHFVFLALLLISVACAVAPSADPFPTPDPLAAIRDEATRARLRQLYRDMDAACGVRETCRAEYEADIGELISDIVIEEQANDPCRPTGQDQPTSSDLTQWEVETVRGFRQDLRRFIEAETTYDVRQREDGYIVVEVEETNVPVAPSLGTSWGSLVSLVRSGPIELGATISVPRQARASVEIDQDATTQDSTLTGGVWLNVELLDEHGKELTETHIRLSGKPYVIGFDNVEASRVASYRFKVSLYVTENAPGEENPLRVAFKGECFRVGDVVLFGRE